MNDYFNEYATFAGAKGLPSPADTPYETPDYIRSKRASRATNNSSREQSSSPPPLPPDVHEPHERTRDPRYGSLDPRRFTPTLHASLVSEILSLRRELDTKNNLVENLETTLADAKNENETLQDKITQQSKDVRKAKLQVQQLEKGTYDAVEELAKERDRALSSLDDLRTKLDVAQRQVRAQDEDALRTQNVWETEKESWDNERRQLERRIHVTESHLRAVADEIASHKASNELLDQAANTPRETHFNDSGIGNESDAGSTYSRSPARHTRDDSSLSFRSRSQRDSTMSRALETPEPHARPAGSNLADELGIHEEEEYYDDDDDDGTGRHAEELDSDPSQRLRTNTESRKSANGDLSSRIRLFEGLAKESMNSPVSSPTARDFGDSPIKSKRVSEDATRSLVDDAEVGKLPPLRNVQYVDNGFQPSPPPSPPALQATAGETPVPGINEPSMGRGDDNANNMEVQPTTLDVANKAIAPPISPPQTPVEDVSPQEAVRIAAPSPSYNTASTQTEVPQTTLSQIDQHRRHQSRDSLSPPAFVPSIAIHPSSRPSTPSRTYVLPPGTKNASTQSSISWESRNASVQTEPIRVPNRPIKLPPHLLPGYVLPSPPLAEAAQSRLLKRASATQMPKIAVNKPGPAPAVRSPSLHSPQESSPQKLSRTNSQEGARPAPYRVIPLPRPVLSPILTQGELVSEGPLNRSSQYGVTKPAQLISPLLDVDKESELSESETHADGFDPSDLSFSLPGIIKPPQGRFGLSEPPKAVPEDKEISPERRPSTSGSHGAAPAPSVSSSRANSTRARGKAPARLNSYKDLRSRSPSVYSRASSSYSTYSAVPPYPIPSRSSSRPVTNAYSEGSQSPTPYHYADSFGQRPPRKSRAESSRQASLRKVQSAAVIRQSRQRGSPNKGRRRRHSPDLTPVQSMMFESPAATQFPIPELPSSSTFDYVKGSVDLRSNTVSSAPRDSEETNLVDAIAATMVGEWMWKYIRRKKSFGVQEDFPISVDGSVSITAGSTRHKRWVWLSPYERTIMWDSKQPIMNSALLGKKGRKLSIQSVLDVHDATSLPRNPELATAFHRSILILTPQRALKFTTASAERHLLWMTALSFLAQSDRLPSQIPPLPSQSPRAAAPFLPSRQPRVPDRELPVATRNRSPSFGRRTVRDSIRLAKGKHPEVPNNTSQTLPPTVPEIDDTMTARDDSADFPAIPRLYISTHRHLRKRSNTSPRLPPPLNNLRNFSSTGLSSSSGAAANHSSLHPTSTSSSIFRTNPGSSKSGSQRESLASPDRPNFFEAVGTVRMEAFVDPNVRDGVLYVPAPPPVGPIGGFSGGQAEPFRGRMRGDSSTSQVSMERRRAGHVFDDPFKSFDFTATSGIEAR